jgi:hypothetical protein
MTFQVLSLFLLALPIASIAWTITHEKVVREFRDVCLGKSTTCRELNGGKGLSVGDIDGKIDGEDRGKQDDAQKATTSVADEAMGLNASGKKVTGTAKRGAKRQAS